MAFFGVYVEEGWKKIYLWLRKKKRSQFFFRQPMGPNPHQTTFLSKSKLKKVNFWSKICTPNYPEICHVPAVQGSGGAHWCPSKSPTVSKKSKKILPELHLVEIFCEKKTQTVAKHSVTRSKITLFRLAIPNMAGFWKKKVEFSCFLGFWGFPASEFC